LLIPNLINFLLLQANTVCKRGSIAASARYSESNNIAKEGGNQKIKPEMKRRNKDVKRGSTVNENNTPCHFRRPCHPCRPCLLSRFLQVGLARPPGHSLRAFQPRQSRQACLPILSGLGFRVQGFDNRFQITATRF
jgi:hypothetical protein